MVDPKAVENGVQETGTMIPPVTAEPVITGLYNHSFFNPELRMKRKLLIPALILPVLYTTLLMWLCLSIYWGSLVSSNDVTKLKVYAVNLDPGGFLGDELINGIKSAVSSPNQLNWQFDTQIHSTADSQAIIYDEDAWGVLQINPNASGILDNALGSGDSSYNPFGAVTLFYASARNQITVNSHVVPAVLAAVNPILSKASVENTAKFLGGSRNNQSVLQTALNCPQCLATPFALNSVDLIPFDSATAQGSVMVGMIFLLTFTFSIFQILHVSGDLIGGDLKLTSAITFRTAASLISYLILSLSYTLINLAFGVPMDRHFGQGGFIVYWLLNFCTMGATGLVMESLFTLIGLKWAGYFLSFWIIVNVSPAFTSFDSMPSFFKYGYAFPFYHSIQGARTIIFGTKDHLGLNFGVLIIWMLLGLFGMHALTAWRMRTNSKEGVHAVP